MKKIIIRFFCILVPTRLKDFITNKIANVARQVYAEEWFSKTVIPLEQRLSRLEMAYQQADKLKDWFALTIETFEQKILRLEKSIQHEAEAMIPLEQRISRLEVSYQQIDKLKDWFALTLEPFEQKILHLEKTIQDETEELLSDAEYLHLEEVAHRKFNEQSSEYKNKLSGYAQGAESVLELGCGEGELLLYLKDKFGEDITVTGVDNNEAMAEKTRSKDINCISKDALSALEALPNNSQDVIYALHIIEHLNSKYLRDVFNECFRCLKEQGDLVIETPNTQSLYTLSHYYFRDATHQIPRHPSLILYLLECIGFHELEIEFLDLPNEELIPVDHDSESLRRVGKRLNELVFSSGNNVLITAKKI